MDISDITDTDLQYEIIGPNIIEEYKNQVTKRMEDVGYMNFLAGYPSSVFQDFGSYLRKEVDLVENDFRLVLDKHNSSFNTSELQPGIYTFKYISEALFNILQPEYPSSSSEIVTEYDDITIKNKLVIRSRVIAVRFVDKPFFSTTLGFNHGWDYKHSNDYTS